MPPENTAQSIENSTVPQDKSALDGGHRSDAPFATTEQQAFADRVGIKPGGLADLGQTRTGQAYTPEQVMDTTSAVQQEVKTPEKPQVVWSPITVDQKSTQNGVPESGSAPARESAPLDAEKSWNDKVDQWATEAKDRAKQSTDQIFDQQRQQMHQEVADAQNRMSNVGADSVQSEIHEPQNVSANEQSHSVSEIKTDEDPAPDETRDSHEENMSVREIPTIAEAQIPELGIMVEKWGEEDLRQLAEKRAHSEGRSVEGRDLRWARSIQDRILTAHDAFMNARDSETLLRKMDQSNVDVRNLVKKEYARAVRAQDKLSLLIDDLKDFEIHTIDVEEGQREIPEADHDLTAMRDAMIRAMVEQKLQAAKEQREESNARRRERYAAKKAAERLNQDQRDVLGEQTQDIPVGEIEFENDANGGSNEERTNKLREETEAQFDALEQRVMAELESNSDQLTTRLQEIADDLNTEVASGLSALPGDMDVKKGLWKGIRSRMKVEKVKHMLSSGKVKRGVVATAIGGMMVTGIMNQPSDEQPIVDQADGSTDPGIETVNMQNQNDSEQNAPVVTIETPDSSSTNTVTGDQSEQNPQNQAPETSDLNSTIDAANTVDAIPQRPTFEVAEVVPPTETPPSPTTESQDVHIFQSGAQTENNQPDTPTASVEMTEEQKQQMLETQMKKAVEDYLNQGTLTGVGDDKTWIDSESKWNTMLAKNWTNDENGHTKSRVMADIDRHLVEKNAGKPFNEIYKSLSDEQKSVYWRAINSNDAQDYINNVQEDVVNILLS